ncbi:hypothetical protein LTR28_011641 [Elasticomyces elasticus]|nr:hypothetical protein LTR28_011641 [Elasticomyces elasticus]
MLPSSKKSLESSGLAPRAAAWTLIGCFLAGVIGIQILSRVLHHFIPSHVVDCEHSHDEEAPETRGPKDHSFGRAEAEDKPAARTFATLVIPPEAFPGPAIIFPKWDFRTAYCNRRDRGDRSRLGPNDSKAIPARTLDLDVCAAYV